MFRGGVAEIAQTRLKQLVSGLSNFSVRCYDMSVFLKDERVQNFVVMRHLSLATYYRLFITQIMPDYDKIVYLDCDLVAVQDVAELYYTDIGENYLGAVWDKKIADYFIPKTEFVSYITGLGLKDVSRYFNAGILVMNLKAIRRDNLEKHFFEMAQKNNRFFHDQNVMNVCCQDGVVLLPEKWNIQCNSEYDIHAQKALIHYCSQEKPWFNPSILFAEYFWQYARKTPFYEELLYHMVLKLLPPPVPQTNKNKVSKIKRLKYKILYKLSFGKIRKKYKSKYKAVKGK